MPNAPSALQERDNWFSRNFIQSSNPLKEPECDQLETLGKDLEDVWSEQLETLGRERASLKWALIKCFGPHFLVAALWEIIGKCLFGILVAVTLGLLIGDIQSYSISLKQPPDPSRPRPDTGSSWDWNSLEAIIVGKSILLFIFMCGNILASQYYLFHSTYVGMKCRLACTYLIYRKALRISLLTLESTTSGQILNLISNDVSKFDSAFYYLQYFYIAPLQMIVIFVLLATVYMGPLATLTGASLVVIYLVIQIYLGQAYGRYRIESTIKSDERVRLTGELVDSIAIIKMYAWEEFFEKNIRALREAELSVLRKVLTLRAINLSLFYGACKLILMVIFVAYVLMGYKFDAVKVFTAITMTNSMRTYLTLFFPSSIAQVSEMQISLERIRQFLTQEDLKTVVAPDQRSAAAPLPLTVLALRQAESSSSKQGPHSFSGRKFVLITPDGPVFQAQAEPASIATAAKQFKLEHQRQQQQPPQSQLQPQKTSSTTVITISADGKTDLLLKPKKPDKCTICTRFDNNRLLIDKKFAIIFHEASAAWPKAATHELSAQTPNQPYVERAKQELLRSDQSNVIFNNLTAHIKHHEFVMIVGRVGSGKSTLLMTILNELPIKSGSIRINGSLSYASQEPWLFAGTVRENITISWHKRAGRDYKHLPKRLERRYQEVLRICCLDRDLKHLPNGDLTTVGERGTTLSGGQRARVNLARALFYDADIYLLDDPLSAVDSEVAKYIFDECFKSFLKRKTVLLVTHQVQFSTPAQKVLLLYDSPDFFSYGPATQVLHSLFKQYNLNPKAAVASEATNEERAVVPITVTEEPTDLKHESSPSEPLGEVESNSLANMKSFTSDDLEQTVNSSDEPFAVTNTSESTPESVRATNLNAGTIPDAKRSIKQAVQKSVIKSPSLRLMASLTECTELPADSETYLYYRRKAATIWIVVIFLTANILTQILFNGTDYFLSEWSDMEERRDSVGKPRIELKYMCLIYLLIITLLLCASFSRNMIFFRSCAKASHSIHEETLHGVLHAPMSFFERNSIGSILARFSTDLSTLDDSVPQAAIDVVEISTNVVGIIIVTAIVSLYNVIPALVILFVVNYLRSSSNAAITRLKQLEAINRSRVFSYVISTLHGLTTIRVFQLESVTNRRFENAQNEHTGAWYAFLTGRHRLTMAIDGACMVYFFVLMAITMTCVFLGFIEASLVGLLISQIIILPGPLQWGARQITELQSLMTSVMRIKDYVTLKDEQEILSRPKLKAPPNWPQNGLIKYDGVTLSYVNGTDVLHNIGFQVNAGERVGIVGRTGAGKSSIISALFRMTDFKGRILIDGIDTKHVSLKELRNSISIIPQEPVLFSGSIRHNLDPFGQHKDDVIWSALNCVQLKKVIAELDGGLGASVVEGGHNFSAGQRQLICLARAILRRNKILILDEATANVDPQTDKFIQTTIRDVFVGCTVITIAHRLHTIMDSDRVLVLDASEVREYDEPHTLLQNKTGFLANMVSSTGDSAEKLRRVAEMSYQKKRRMAKL